MAGAIAMASVIEDFETQPSKKRKKDSDASGVKAITNYFSPVAKVVEKPFSPPRPSNIMDYFKKTPPATKVTSPQSQPKENEVQPQGTVTGTDPTTNKRGKASKKPGRKVGRPVKKALVLNPPGADEGVVVVEAESKAQVQNRPADATVPVGATTNAAPSGENNNKTVGGEDKMADESSHIDYVTPHSNKAAGLKESSESHMVSARTDSGMQDGVGPLGSSTPEEKGKKGRAVKKASRKGKTDPLQQDVPLMQQQCPEQQQLQPQLPSDAGLETEAKEESQLNLSTVTVSFADFLESQSPKAAERRQSEDVKEDKDKTEATESRTTPSTVDQDTNSLSVAKLPGEVGGDQPPAQVSPRTLTVLAEVHPISPDQDLSRATGHKMASIFTACRKTKDKPVTSPQPQANSEPPLAPLRKSNVVLQEEDLELAVLEAGSSVPKCSQAERKQFMNAFKQPGVDAAKGKASKAGKQKQQAAEKAAPTEGETEEGEGKEVGGKAKGAEGGMEEADPNTVEPKGVARKAAGKRKRGRPKKDQGNVPEGATTSVAPPAETPALAPPAPDVREKDKTNQPSGAQATSTPTPTVTETKRRSARERACKPSPPALLTPTPQSESKGTESSSKARDPAGLPCTPKTRHPKRGVYKSHMLAPPDDKGSPIRMKFTRVFSSPGEISEFEILSPLAKEDMKKRKKKAQKLVQKAKALQQSKQAATEENAPPRRSSRCQDTAKKNYCEPEDSVICVEDDESSSTNKAEDTKAKNKKQVRSLNDVLGKNASGTKVAKTPAVTGTKVAAVFLGKKPQKPAAVISLLDDSSRDASDASQDDEKFRARREFLKSGLPESFRKQIAKTAASREAYTLSCASFQSVVHVLQTPEDCPLWSLPWPQCPRLSCLKEAGAVVSSPSQAVVGKLSLSIRPARRRCGEQAVSGWREDLSEEVQRWLLEEITASNPSFPAQRLLTQLLKRRAEHLLKPTCPEADSVSKEAACGSKGSQPVGGKRKREEEEQGGATEKVAKRQRPSRKEPETITVPDEAPGPPRRGRGGRGRPRRQEEGVEEETKPAVAPPPPAAPQKADSVVEHTSTEDVAREDVMWTEKYQPQHSSDVVGNMHSVRRLHSWLREWKLRADHEERKRQQEKKSGEDCNESWMSECGEGLEEDLLCNTLLITGPTGVGKTAAVYACAQELGFKVFEVNCSSQRSGRQILSQLKEATQSHQVDHGVNAHKPTFFNNYSSSSSGGGSGSRPGSSPRKVNSPRRVVSSPHKPPQSPRRGPGKRGSLAPTALANFFKMGSKPPPKESAEANGKPLQPVSKSPRKRAKSKAEDLSSGSPAVPVTPTTPAPVTPPVTTTSVPLGKAQGDEQGKRTATSLILFEEVDVIFDEDSGFLAAIKTFMSTTKRPVILTTSDPTFRTTFDGYLEEIHFDAPSVADTSSYLQLLCVAESVRVGAEDVASLLRCTGGDVRQSLLQLQLWVRSGAAGPYRGLPTLTGTQLLQGSGSGAAAEEDGKPDLPPCEANITPSLLGLLNIQPQGSLLDFLKCEFASPVCWELLVEAGRRGLTLLYSNLEALLPLPSRTLTYSLSIAQHKPELDQTAPASVPAPTSAPGSAIPSSCLPPQPTMPNPNTKPCLLVETEDEASPLKVSSRMRQKKQVRPESRDPFQSDSDSEDGFLSLPRLASASAPTPAEPPPVRPAVERRKRAELTKAERKAGIPVSVALGAMAEFLEHMSFLDSSLPCPASRVTEGSVCAPGAAEYGWAPAEIRSGLTDEPRMESSRQAGHHWAMEEQAREVRAAVESLSFGRCKAGVEQAWGAVQALEEEGEKEEEEEGVRKVALEEITLPVAPHRQAFSITPDDTLSQAGSVQQRCELMRSVCISRVGSTGSSRMATALDVLPALRTICRSEQLKEQGKVKRRFLHYLDGINLGLPKQTLQLLATDFL